MKRLAPLIAALAIGAAACSSTDGGTLTVYSGRSEELVGPILEQFSEASGINVEVRYGQSADLALLIQEEGDRSPADVFISQSPGALGLLAGAGLLDSISAETLDLVAEEHRNGNGEWIGITGRVRVLVYNSDLVDPFDLPGSVFDLTEPQYEGRVAVAPANGSFQDFVTGMREIHGDESTAAWLSGLAANHAAAYANNSSIVQAVARGEVDMGLVNHYYNLRALAEDPSLPSRNHHFADVGSLVIITGAGVLESTDSSEEADALLSYLLGPEAQSFFTEETFEYPLASGAEAAEGLAGLGDVESLTYDFNDLSGGLARTQELIDESGLAQP